MHRLRLGSPGDVALVLAHAVSHIKANRNDLSNDLDPAFIKEFHANLKLITQELAKRRSVPAMPRGAVVSTSPAPAAPSAKSDATAPAPLGGYFSADAMQERLKQYTAAAGNAPLAEYMARYSGGDAAAAAQSFSSSKPVPEPALAVGASSVSSPRMRVTDVDGDGVPDVVGDDGRPVGTLHHVETQSRIVLEANYKEEEAKEKADLKRRLEERKKKRGGARGAS